MNKKYLFFKNEIASNLNSAEKTTLAFKSPEDFSRNKVNVNPNKISKLNPNLKMIAEDPKIISENEMAINNEESPEVVIPSEQSERGNLSISQLLSKTMDRLPRQAFSLPRNDRRN